MVQFNMQTVCLHQCLNVQPCTFFEMPTLFSLQEKQAQHSCPPKASPILSFAKQFPSHCLANIQCQKFLGMLAMSATLCCTADCFKAGGWLLGGMEVG